jgi:TPR repeat protein
LGKLFLSGKGDLKQDDAQASALFKRACDGGHLQAYYHQGVLEYLLNGEDKKTGKTRDTKHQLNAIIVLEKAYEVI